MNDLTPYLEALLAVAHPEGGWAYRPGQPPQPEPTCLAMLALSLEGDRYRPSIERGFEVLRRGGGPDGSFRLVKGREAAVWPTALVLFLQAELGRPEEEVARTAQRLLGLRGRVIPEDPEMVHAHDIDMMLVGWPWAENNFSWAEPTAWACLALRRAGYGTHPRVEEGLRLLLDRAFDEGGINYGNRRVFGLMTQPIPGPTALMLLALQGRPEQPRVNAAIGFLRQVAGEQTDLEHLCWTKLALEIYRDRPGMDATLTELEERIKHAYQSRQATSWLGPAPVREALTALALGTDRRNPFRLSPPSDKQVASLAVSPHSAGTPSSRKPLGERVKAAFRGVLVRGIEALRPPPLQSAVHIAPVANYNADLADTLQRQYGAFRERLPLTGKRVVLKPNLVEYHPDKVINTDPRVVAAAIELCKREGAAEIVVAEGPGHWRNLEYLVQASGLGEVLRHYQVGFVDLNHDEPMKVLNLGRLTGLEYLYQARTVATAEVLISLAKLKTHHWAGATLSLKNLFGTLPGTCYGWPKNELHWRGIDRSIIDIALTKPPDLAIVDGIIGMEGDGPINGTAKPLGALIMGTDPVAVDATCCRLMQLNPEKVGYLLLGQFKKLGRLKEAEIPQIGERIDALAGPFETLPHFRELYLGRTA